MLRLYSKITHSPGWGPGFCIFTFESPSYHQARESHLYILPFIKDLCCVRHCFKVPGRWNWIKQNLCSWRVDVQVEETVHKHRSRNYTPYMKMAITLWSKLGREWKAMQMQWVVKSLRQGQVRWTWGTMRGQAGWSAGARGEWKEVRSKEGRAEHRGGQGRSAEGLQPSLELLSQHRPLEKTQGLLCCILSCPHSYQTTHSFRAGTVYFPGFGVVCHTSYKLHKYLC